MSNIAPTAIVDKTAQLGQNVSIGPGCVIQPDVVIGDDCEIRANAIICTGVTMGKRNRVFSNAVLGEEPQISSLHEPATQLIIGDDNTFREAVTISRGSPNFGGKTVVGNSNYIMAGAHFGHDCVIESNITVCNYAQVAGHCKIESNAYVGALSGTHQFVTIGRFCYVGGASALSFDQPPFMRVAGSYPCTVRSVNLVGLQRAGISPQGIDAVKTAYRKLYRHKEGHAILTIVDELAQQGPLDQNVEYLLDFIKRSAQNRLGRYLESFRH